MSCILDQSVQSKMKLLIICAANRVFIWSLCSAAFREAPLVCCALHWLYGQCLWLPSYHPMHN